MRFRYAVVGTCDSLRYRRHAGRCSAGHRARPGLRAELGGNGVGAQPAPNGDAQRMAGRAKTPNRVQTTHSYSRNPRVVVSSAGSGASLFERSCRPAQKIPGLLPGLAGFSTTTPIRTRRHSSTMARGAEKSQLEDDLPPPPPYI